MSLRQRLFAQGTGWLRFRCDHWDIWEYEPDAHASHVVGQHVIAPPLTLVAWWVKGWLLLPASTLRFWQLWHSWPAMEEVRGAWMDLRDGHTPGPADWYRRPGR